MINSCSCQTDKFGVIDLAPLASTNGTPRYQNFAQPTRPNVVYSWNPCQPFTVGACQNVAICQKVVLSSYSAYYSLGSHSSAQFVASDGHYFLSYSESFLGIVKNSTAWAFERTAYIKLVCDVEQDPGEFIVIGEDSDTFGKYHFELRSLHACPESQKPVATVDAGLSTGSIFLIVMTVVALLYLSVGMAIQTFLLNKSGWQRVPNSEMWGALPGLVKDGVVLVVNRGRRSSSLYSEIK